MMTIPKNNPMVMPAMAPGSMPVDCVSFADTSLVPLVSSGTGGGGGVASVHVIPEFWFASLIISSALVLHDCATKNSVMLPAFVVQFRRMHLGLEAGHAVRFVFVRHLLSLLPVSEALGGGHVFGTDRNALFPVALPSQHGSGGGGTGCEGVVDDFEGDEVFAEVAAVCAAEVATE